MAADSGRPSDPPKNTTHDVVEAIMSALDREYPIPEISDKYVAHLKNLLQVGRFDGLESEPLAALITQELRAVHRDLHLAVVPRKTLSSDGGGTPSAIDNGSGLQAIELDQETSTAYIRWPGSWKSKQEAFDAAICAMRIASHSDNIVIDIRDNPGGTGQIGRLLASYFFDVGVEHLYLSGHYRNHDLDEQEWTLPYVPGLRASRSKLFILVNRATASAAEGFAFAMQRLGRGIVVGDTTAGAGIAMRYHVLSSELALALPVKMIVAPRSEEGWEGIGVEPDVVANGADARKIAFDLIRSERDARSKGSS